MFYIPKQDCLQSANLTETIKLIKNVELHPIGCNNWPGNYPYTPRAGFRMAHNGEELFISFTVQEECTMANITEDNGEVWTDSCVEFFITLDDSGYYNFEFNCIGKALLGFRKKRSSGAHAKPKVMATIKRYSTLGTENFTEKHLDTPWELIVAIPATALFRHKLQSWNDIKANINLYKCGDSLSKPHYLSWNPIDTKKPDFHVPACFKAVTFQSK